MYINITPNVDLYVRPNEISVYYNSTRRCCDIGACTCLAVYYILYTHIFNMRTILTYLLTPWCRVLLEKLSGLQLVKKFPAFHGTPRFITALTSVRHLSLFWASSIKSIYPHPTSWRSILILSTHLRLGLPSGSFSPVFPPGPYTPRPMRTIVI